MKQSTAKIPEGYKNTPLGIIPNEWEVKKIKEIGQVVTGNTPATSEKENYGDSYLFVSPADLSDLKYIKNTEKKLSLIGFEKSRKLPKGAVLFTCIGLIGKVGISLCDLSCNQQINAIICNELMFNEYLYYELRIRASKIKLIAGEQVLPIINKSDFENVKILIPPLPEQRKIAEVLSTWDRAIEKQMLLVEKLELRKKGLMQQLLTGKKRLHGFSGGAWKKVKLGDIGQCYSGLTNKNKSDFECGAAKFITYMNVFCHGKIDINILGRVNIEADEKQEKVKKGDIFFTVSSETPEEVGMSSVLMDDVNNTYLNSFCFGFRLYNNEILLPKYAIYAFRGTDMRKNMYRIAQGSTRFNLSKDEVMSLKITVPTVQEQNAIAEILSVCDNEITLARQKLDTLRQQKKGLMQVLLTGKKRIKI